MMLRDAMVKQGNWLFRWRGVLPLLLLPAVIPAVIESGRVENLLGHAMKDWWEVFAICVAFLGLFVRSTAIGSAAPGTSGRNTSGQRANSLNSTGIYSVVRNPLYLGNFLMVIGLAMMPGAWWFVLLVGLVFFVYYERIICAEEAYLEQKFGDEYREWAAQTPVFIPRMRLWQASEERFSFKKVLRHEYSGLYVIIAFSTLIDMMCDLIGERETLLQWWHEDQVWIVYFVIGTALYLTLRHLKKHTMLLDMPSPAG